MDLVVQNKIVENKPEQTFTAKCPVYFDDLDAYGFLYNGRYVALVERGIASRLATMGLHVGHEDLIVGIREIRVIFGTPIRKVGEVDLEFWVSNMTRSSAVFEFLVTSGDVEHARGIRAVTKYDPAIGRSAPWSDEVRAIFGGQGEQPAKSGANGDGLA